MSGRRLLLLAPFPPRLDGTHGGSRAIANLIAGLAPHHRIALLCLRTADEEPLDPAVAAACEIAETIGRPGTAASSVRPWHRALRLLPLLRDRPLWVAARWSPRFAARARALAADWRPGIVQAEYHAMGQYLRTLGAGAPPAVLTEHEPGVVSAAALVHTARGPARVFWKRDARRWAKYEARLLRTAAATVVFTERDRQRLAGLEPGANLVRIPLPIEIPAAPLDPRGTDPHAVVFIGNFLHPPNADAAAWLVREILPALRARVPAARLTIVGPGGPEALAGIAADGVEATGRVPAVAPFLDAAAVVVAPLRQGGGMRVKVAEALAAGKAVVATSLALEGIDLRIGHDALAADDADGLAAAIASLLADPERRERIARAGRRVAEAHLGRHRVAARYAELYDRLLAGAPIAEGSGAAR